MLRDHSATALAGRGALPHCDSGETIRRGFDGPEKHLRRYECKSCGRRFDDLTGTALSGVVECDEACQVAGPHKGQPEKVAWAGRKPCRRRLKDARGRGTKATEKPPIFGMVQRSGEVTIRLLDNVRRKPSEEGYHTIQQKPYGMGIF